MAKAKLWTLINYFDVWGNEVDGWEVNDSRIERNDIAIDDSMTNKDILDKLVEVGFLTTSDMRRLAVEDMGELITVFERKGMKPICALSLNV